MAYIYASSSKLIEKTRAHKLSALPKRVYLRPDVGLLRNISPGRPTLYTTVIHSGTKHASYAACVNIIKRKIQFWTFLVMALSAGQFITELILELSDDEN